MRPRPITNGMKKIAYFSNTDFSLCNFRLGLMREMKKRDFQVFACAGKTKEEYVEKLRREFTFKDFPLRRSIDLLGRDLVYLFRGFRFCKKEKPGVCHNFTVKPCIYGTLAQKWAGVKNIYCTVTGSGYSFGEKGTLNKLVVWLYRISLKHATRVIFQNPDDREMFVNLEIVKVEKTAVIKGSGVDTNHFSPTSIAGSDPAMDPAMKVVFVGRMLYAKGVKEFVEVAKILKKKHNNLEFLLVGPLDNENPSAVPEKEIKNWEEEGLVKYLGERKDIKEILSSSSIFVFPSFYGEGVPKALLEAGAMSLPLVTTDTPGCREVVEDNVNGFLVEPQNSKDLAEKIEILINDKDLRKRFGKASREKIVKEFDEKIIVKKYLEVIDGLL